MKTHLYSIPAFILRQWLCRVFFSGLLMLGSLFTFAQAPTAGFTADIADTTWIFSPCNIANTSLNSQKNYWDVVSFSSSYSGPYSAYTETRHHKNSQGINDFFLDTTQYKNDFKGYTFPTRGYYLLKLVAWNTSGFDTYTDTLFVDTPSTPPVADFTIDRTIIGVYNDAKLTDLTTNGAVMWYWYLDPPFYNPAIPFFNVFGPTSSAQNPLLYANEKGVFDICLQATNHRGTTTICKPDHIRIIQGYIACAGTPATMKDTLASDHEGVVKLTTVAGIYLPSLVGSCSKGYMIQTAGDTLALFIEKFNMRPIDSLFIRSGSKTGPILYKFGGSTALDSVKIAGGVAYLQTVLGNTIGAGYEGWTIRWRDSSATALPVSFTSFEAKLANKQDVQLLWATASEQNNKGFAIERSANGSDWLEVDFVKGKGNSTRLSQYSFTDVSPFNTAPTLYYRLRQVDFDGKVSYSKTVTVHYAATQKASINVSPNPFEGIPVLTIQSDKAAPGTIAIFDIYGKQLMLKEAMLVKGTNTFALTETGTLKPGSYILNVTIENDTQAFRLLKK